MQNSYIMMIHSAWIDYEVLCSSSTQQESRAVCDYLMPVDDVTQQLTTKLNKIGLSDM